MAARQRGGARRLAEGLARYASVSNQSTTNWLIEQNIASALNGADAGESGSASRVSRSRDVNQLAEDFFHPAERGRLIESLAIGIDCYANVLMPKKLRDGEVVFRLFLQPGVREDISEKMRGDYPPTVP